MAVYIAMAKVKMRPFMFDVETWLGLPMDL